MKHILFIGSSVVRGQFGVDWISQLPPDENVTYYNFGINGAQVPGVFDFVKTKDLQFTPTAVCIMVGGNDMSNSIPFTKYAGMDFGRCGRSAPTSSIQFGQEMEELITLIEEKWGVVPMAVFNLKPASEKIDGNLNQIVESFNSSLGTVCEKHSNITFLDMYTPLIALLKGRTPHPLADDINHVISVERMMEVLIYRYLTFGAYTQNDFGDARGFYLFSDGIHFNERAAAVVLEVFKPFLESVKNM